MPGHALAAGDMGVSKMKEACHGEERHVHLMVTYVRTRCWSSPGAFRMQDGAHIQGGAGIKFVCCQEKVKRGIEWEEGRVRIFQAEGKLGAKTQHG